jgi:putative ABC transport system substrate-binding protein
MRSEGYHQRLACLLFLSIVCGSGAAVAAHPPVALVSSSAALVPFRQAADAIKERLGKEPTQPELIMFDLGGDQAAVRGVLAEVRRANPALIVTIGSLATSAVLAEDWPVPVVFSMVLYPAQSGFLTKRSRGVTGASLDVPLELQFRTIRRLLPNARRMGVLYHPAETGGIIAAGRAAAAKENFELDARAIDKPADALDALTDLLERVDVLWTVADSYVFASQNTSALILTSLRRRIPMFGLSTAQVRMGALAALSCDYHDVGIQTAEIVARVLNGEHAADIPLTAARKINLALNLHSAEHLGIELTPAVKRDAVEVVE